jgi:hypothetical protein
MLKLAVIMAVVLFFGVIQDLPEGQGKVLLENFCTTCHDLDRVKKKHYDKESWQGLIESMRDKRDGPKDLTEDDIKVLADYLAKNFGPEGDKK